MKRLLCFCTLAVFVNMDRVNAALIPPETNGNYTVSFEEVSQGSEHFVYRERQADGSIVDRYYKITYTPNILTNNRVASDVVGPITDDFIGNTSTFIGDSTDQGGAISNIYGNNLITFIKGDFIQNSVVSMDSNKALGGAIYNVSDSTIGDITGNFIGNYISADYNSSGGAIYNYNSTTGDITGDFVGNYAFSSYSRSSGGAIYNYASSTMGDISGDFIGNYASADYYSQGGAIYNSEYSTIGNITGDFIGNSVFRSYYSYGGAIYNSEYSTIGNITGDFIGNYTQSSGASSGGAIYNYEGSKIGNITGDFIGNYVSVFSNSYGGAIYNSGTINFLGDVSFIGNYVQSASATDSGYASGGAIYYSGYSSGGVFSPQEFGQNILFENNYAAWNGGKQLNSIHLDSFSSTVNFLLQSDTVADIRDPVSGYGTINKDVVRFFDEEGNVTGTGDGEGKLLLWGDNSEFFGDLNINTGIFYAMFDETDPDWTQRHTFITPATLSFGNGTVYRPRVSPTQIAVATNIGTVGSGVTFLPYDLSGLDVGTHTYGVDYSKFNGWESDLAKVDLTSSSQTVIEIKSNLEGYQGLSALADVYRKRTDLSYDERDELDYIYMTGNVSQAILDMFTVAEGQDIVNYEQAHRGSVRQFGRQIVSRINNKNCSTCGRDAGYSDEHLWMNVGQNWIDKDSTKKTLGYTYKPTSFAVGYDTDLIPQAWNAGVALSYAFGEAETKSGYIESINDISEYLLAVYTKYKPFRAYASGSIGGGLITNDTRFISEGINAKSDYDSQAFFINTEFGYDFFSTVCGVFEPYIGAEYTYLHSDAHTERGIGARHFDSMEWHLFEVPVGIRMSRDLFMERYILTPALDVAYVHNFGDTGSSTQANFVGNAGDRWKVSSSSEKRDSFRGAANFKINHRNSPFALNLGYAIDYRSDYTDQQIYGTIRYDF